MSDTTRLSQGGFQTARDCKRKYNYRHVRQLQRRGGDSSDALNLGKLWHKVLPRWFRERNCDGMLLFIKGLARSDEDAQRCLAMLAGYVAQWQNDDIVMSLHEQEIEAPIRNPATGRRSRKFSQYGYLDMLALHDDGSIWLWEHKTASSIGGGYIEKLFSDAQITGYYAALLDMGIDVKGVVYDVAMKPKLRQKKDESLDKFYERLAEWHMRPEAYHREEVYISDRQVRDWREDVWQVTQELLSCHRTGYWYRNTGRCFDYYRPCEFVALCQNGVPEALINAEYETRELPSDNHNNQPQKPVW